jgi:uncharacterized protein YaiI (UPF0178 family)
VLEIYVDADACPVKAEILRVAERHQLTVHMVSNQWMRVGNYPRINRVVVPNEPDAADDWIAGHCGPGDIAVTADILLAERCIKAGADVMGPTGRPFAEHNIGMAIATRDLMAHLREAGEIKDNAPAFTKQDRSRFLDALENLIQAIHRRG